MAGTVAGGKRAALKNLEGDPDFYRRIGSIGGRNGHTGGFASSIECKCRLYIKPHSHARCAGKKGGAKSKRTKKLVEA
jgi:hypothetical protein